MELLATPVRVQALAASLRPPRVLVLVLVASPSKRPRAPVRALAVALTPRALALQRVVLSMPRERAQPLAFASTRALGLLLGPYYCPVPRLAAPMRSNLGRPLTGC